MKAPPSITLPTRYHSTRSGWTVRFQSRASGRALAKAFIAFGRRNGLLPKANCAMCNTAYRPRFIHWHHEDYAKPNVVTPLCASCHIKRHHHDIGFGSTRTLVVPKRHQERAKNHAKTYQSSQELAYLDITIGRKGGTA